MAAALVAALGVPATGAAEPGPRAGAAAAAAPRASAPRDSAPAAAIPRASAPAAPTPAAAVPRTVVLDGKRLWRTKVRLKAGDRKLERALRDLTAQADAWLGQGPWTVTDKDQVPPGGDKHDYFSQAPYWWPTLPRTADNPYGCPYVQKDGRRNPDVDKLTDHPERAKVFESAYELSLAWYYTGKRAYAEHAAEILRTWFVTPATRMNPSLQHAQFIPCKYDGRAIGIIDFSQGFTSVVDAAAILDSGAPGWSSADRTGMREWNERFLDWLVDSDFGKEESAALNNHGTFADMQVAALAAAVGRRDLARSVVTRARAKRVDAQIAADGSQPGELARTRSWHYSTFNLVAFTRLAAVGDRVGVDLWHHTGPNGAGLFKAVDFLLPSATGEQPWPHPELDFHAYAADDIVHAAADKGDDEARAAVAGLQPPPGGDLWLLRPGAEQLDNILG
ncbi:alginate lyase [Wenjunlia tyrosinilytica]|uniref:Alginate lyase n=1 Tax=Wenjunlia tyrosinilytica TaxID=1544741 RepID=A0A917ZGU8_9ACTN|nr:alginate lyase [Wenjunlia tyrosinilytica]